MKTREEWQMELEDVLGQQIDGMVKDGIDLGEAIQMLKDTADMLENYYDFNTCNEGEEE
jgi:hypothetical protein